MQKIVIGTRGSELALKQAEIVQNALLGLSPSLEFDIRIIKTEGDTNLNPIPLDTVGKGWFTQEIEKALQDGSIDYAVHSLKDMTEVLPAGLIIGAYLEREDARDALITKNGESLDELRPGGIIGTDSSRRQVQMKELRNDLEMRSIRGNVPSRIEKLKTEEYDGIILAVAGLKRLGRANEITRIFEVDEMVPSPGQGILAVECSESNTDLRNLLSLVNDIDAAQAATIERSFSRAVGGGCKSPTGAYARIENDVWTLTGMLVKGNDIRKETMTSPLEDAATLGEMLAKKMLS
jgi:hydroxymethylbilane synthase